MKGTFKALRSLFFECHICANNVMFVLLTEPLGYYRLIYQFRINPSIID